MFALATKIDKINLESVEQVIKLVCININKHSMYTVVKGAKYRSSHQTIHKVLC